MDGKNLDGQTLTVSKAGLGTQHVSEAKGPGAFCLRGEKGTFSDDAFGLPWVRQLVFRCCFSLLFKPSVIVFKPRPKPTYRPTTDPNENFKKAMLTLQVVTGEFSAPVNGFPEVLMTTQTERENVRYRKDVEKAAGAWDCAT